ncbi:hypothetical protein HDV00_004727 [Rhizophlyctis rosea]|nr:hypothetical protein HDV00_004727 [Rhizophlyctis rosea]
MKVALPIRSIPRTSISRILLTPTRGMSNIKESPAGESKHPHGGAGMASREAKLDQEATVGDRYAKAPPGFQVNKEQSHGHRFKYYELDVDNVKRRDAPGWDKWKGDAWGRETAESNKKGGSRDPRGSL